MTIELTDEDAKLFVLFRKHQDLIQTLLDARIQGVKGGQAILHFNPDGKLMEVELKVISFRGGRVVQ